MQKSDTILRAKHQHEETTRSLKERHENEVYQLQSEIDSWTAKDRSQKKEIEQLINRLQKKDKDYHRTINEKSDAIRDLQDKLDTAQKKMTNYIADNSSYSNIKAMKEQYTMDAEKFATEQLNNQVSKHTFLVEKNLLMVLNDLVLNVV